jgi:hypothetical protein
MRPAFSGGVWSRDLTQIQGKAFLTTETRRNARDGLKTVSVNSHRRISVNGSGRRDWSGVGIALPFSVTPCLRGEKLPSGSDGLIELLWTACEGQVRSAFHTFESLGNSFRNGLSAPITCSGHARPDSEPRPTRERTQLALSTIGRAFLSSRTPTDSSDHLRKRSAQPRSRLPSQNLHMR